MKNNIKLYLNPILLKKSRKFQNNHKTLRINYILTLSLEFTV